MYFTRRGFWMPKDVSHPGEYQDAYALDAARGVAAIADGVSSSIFARRWAEILVRAVVERPPYLEDPQSLPRWLAEQRAAWNESIDVQRLAWHQKTKLREGAFSTLLWLKLTRAAAVDGGGDGYELRCHAIGDCLLLVVRDGRQQCAYPLTSADEFTLDPLALGSIDLGRDDQLDFGQPLACPCRAGDLLVLCTDAVGAWALAREENGEPVDWDAYWNLDAEAWADHVLAERDAGQMRHDDATAVLLRLA